MQLYSPNTYEATFIFLSADRSPTATTKCISSRRTFAVVDPVDEDGSLTVVETVTDTTYHVVDYADERLRAKLAARDAGSTGRLDLAPADPEGLDWVVTRVLPGTPPVAGLSPE